MEDTSKSDKPLPQRLGSGRLRSRADAVSPSALPPSLLTDLIHRVIGYVAVLKPDGTLVEVNEPALTAGKLDRADVVGRKFWECYWWSHDPAVQERLREAVARSATGENVRYEELARIADEQLITVDFMLAPSSDADGRASHLIASGTDITGRIAAERQAAEQYELLETIYSSAPVALCQFDTQLRFTQANAFLLNMFGLTEDDLLGKTCTQALPAAAKEPEALLRRVIETGEPVLGHRVDARVPGQPERDRSWSVNYVPIKNHDGHVYAICAAGVETTGTDRSTQLLVKADEQAERDHGELKGIYQSVPVGLCVFDRDLRFCRVNHRMAEMIGFSVEEHLGKSMRDLLPAMADTVDQILRRVLETGEPTIDIEITGETPAQPGVTRIWRCSYLPLRTSNDEIFGINVIGREITAEVRHKRDLNEALELAETRRAELEAVHAVSPAGLCYHDADLTIRYANKRLEEINGIPNAELIGRSPMDNLNDDLAQQVVPLLQRVVLTGRPVVNLQLSWAPPYDADTPHHFLVNYGPVWRGEGEGRQVAGVMAAVIDITDIVESRRQLESWSEQLAEEVAKRTHEVVRNNRRLSRMGREIMETQNRERRRLAKILHDDLQQTLAAARVDADVLAMRDHEGDETVLSLQELLIEASKTARNLSHELYPNVLATDGLCPALAWLSRECRDQYELDIRCDLDDNHQLPGQFQAFLYDVARELLLNVHRHADTNRAELVLRRRDDVITLTVQDQGKGCDEALLMSYDEHRSDSKGLPIIRHRLELLGGSLSVESDEGNGCKILVELPITAED